jgi:uncharacterized protein (TIGR03437 family)
LKGVLTRVAGNSRAGFSGDGGPAIDALINHPLGVAVDAIGNVFIADFGNYRIRKVATTGTISTIAGNGLAGYSGDGGLAINAQMNNPYGVAVDAGGDIYIADPVNARVRRVNPSGIISTFAGNGTFGYSGDGGLAINGEIGYPSGLAIDASGNLYFVDGENNVIRKVDTTGVITTVAGSGMAGYSGDGGLATKAGMSPNAVALDNQGNLYIADYNRIRKVSTSGIITTIAGVGGSGYSGDGGPAKIARFNGVQGIAVDADSNIYIADEGNNRVREVSVGGLISTVAGNGTPGFSGDGGPGISAQLSYPNALAVDASGSIYISDSSNNRIRKLTATEITTVVGSNPGQLSSPSAVAFDSSGNMYIADTGHNQVRKVSPGGIFTTLAGTGAAGSSGDGGPAIDAQLSGPSGVAVDSSENVYISDSGNRAVRQVSPAGMITTIFGGPFGFLEEPGLAGLAIDAQGNLYIAEAVYNRVDKLSPSGIHTLFAGGGNMGYSGDNGPANGALLNSPTSLALDATGNLYIADSSNSVIRRVDRNGIITTIAGTGAPGYSGDDGPAVAAQFFNPLGIVVDTSGRIYVADTDNNAIRELIPVTGGCNPTVSAKSLQAPALGAKLDLTISANCTWTILDLPDWISISVPVTGSGPATVGLSVAANPGPARIANLFVGPNEITVNQDSGEFYLRSFQNAASFSGSATPGSIVSVFGNFPISGPIWASSLPIATTLGGLSFDFGGGNLAPLFYADAGQVNMQIPWDLAGQSQATVTGHAIGPISQQITTVPLATYNPGLFWTKGTQGAILDANNHLVDDSNPAKAGAVIQIFCTGLGPVTNQPPAGVPSPSKPLAETTTQPIVWIGGVQAEVHFSGLTPGSVGLYQVNTTIPKGSGDSSFVPVSMSIGGVISNVVTIAVTTQP